MKAQQSEMKVRSEQYETQIQALEDSKTELEMQLQQKTEQLDRVRGQLTELLESL